MGYPTSRKYIRDSARREADQIEEDGFRSNTEVNKMIDDVASEVDEHILIAQPERKLGYFVFTTVADQTTYPITAADFCKLKDIDAFVNGASAKPKTLREFQWKHRNAYLEDGWRGGRAPLAFRLYGDNIVVTPEPPAGVLCKVWYHPTPKRFVDDTDTIDAVAGWADAIVFGVARRLASQEGDFELADRLFMEYQRQLQRILEFGAVRVTEHVEFIRDVYDPECDWEVP